MLMSKNSFLRWYYLSCKPQYLGIKISKFNIYYYIYAVLKLI